MPGSDRILFDMRDAYGSVEQFLLPEPSMPTGWIAQRRSVGVLARRGRSRRNELIETGLIDREDRLVIVALGGIPTRIDGSSIRAAEATRLLMPTAWQPDRSAGQLAIESLQIPFIDLLASCDVVVAKSGYGTFCEAACNGTALIHPPRPDWPEAPFLESWLMQNGRCETIDSLNALYDNRLAESIDQVCAKPLPVRTPEAAGGEEVAGLILERLGLGACRTLDESAAKAG
jgi:UDP:flavonoid glycosyltransferase YjiC (YdhE family)